jgi:methylated-DNA-protein-cysteine methyltransferase-like protein
VPTGLAVGLALAALCHHQAAIRPGDLGPPLSRPSGKFGAQTLSAYASGVSERDILERVRAVPEGFVRTYGDVSPGAPRAAGAALNKTDDPALPWHRIVRADGSLAKGTRQRRLLEAEGVPFRGARVDMAAARLPDGV